MTHFLIARGVWPASAMVGTMIMAGAVVHIGDLTRELAIFWVQVASLPPLIVMVAVLRTLAGNAVALERSMPRLRPRWRVSHAIVGATLSGAAMLLAGLLALGEPGAVALTRNTVGILGLALLSSSVVRAASAWAPPMGYMLLVMVGAPHNADGFARWWAWSVQPGGSGASWLVATVLLIGGVVTYGRRGPAL